MDSSIYYVYLNTSIMEGVYYSQVEEVLKYVQKSFNNILHISLELRTKEFFKRYNEINKLFNSKYILQSRNLSTYGIQRDVDKIEEIINRHFLCEGNIMIHARGTINTFKAAMLKRKEPEKYRVHGDLRGVIWDEALRGNIIRRLFAPYRSFLYKKWESIAVKESDSLSCVSNVFKKYLHEKYKREDVELIPTFVNNSIFRYSEEIRKMFRNILFVGDKHVMIYSGGVDYWQNINKIIELYYRLKKSLTELVLVFLTNNPCFMQKKFLNKIKIDDIRVLSVPQKDVPGYLCAADFGVLLRDNIPTNNMAAPTKFSEYLCCGLPVVLSPHIGDTEEIINRKRCGYILPKKGVDIDAASIKSLISLDRKDISDYGHSLFSNDIYLKKLMSIYKENCAKG